MAFRDSWHGALVYFGLAEARDPAMDYDDGPDYEPEAELDDRYRERATSVRRLPARRRRGDDFDDIFAEETRGYLRDHGVEEYATAGVTTTAPAVGAQGDDLRTIVRALAPQ